MGWGRWSNEGERVPDGHIRIRWVRNIWEGGCRGRPPANARNAWTPHRPVMIEKLPHGAPRPGLSTGASVMCTPGRVDRLL